MLSPLMQGKLDVVLEFISEEKKYSNITRQIRITGENPKVSENFSHFLRNIHWLVLSKSNQAASFSRNNFFTFLLIFVIIWNEISSGAIDLSPILFFSWN